MKLTNDSYEIRLSTRTFTERYFRDKDGWMKVSARGRTFRMTAEQVLNHLLPALAGVKPVTVAVERRDVAPARRAKATGKKETRPRTRRSGSPTAASK